MDSDNEFFQNDVGNGDSVLFLKTELKHLRNELMLTKQEHEESLRSYFDIFSNMEQMVEERTASLNSVKKILEMKGRELELMLDRSSRMIYYTDLQHKFVRVNASFSKHFNIDYKAVLGQRPEDIFSAEIASLFDFDLEVIEKSEAVSGQVVTYELNGKTVYLKFERLPYHDVNGEVTGVIGFAEDITSQIEAERVHGQLQERIRRAEKMEAVGLLAGGVAHDSNNFLAALIGNLQLLQMEEGLGDMAEEFVGGAMEAAEQLQHLIDDLLTMTRSEGRGKAVIHESVCLNVLLEDFNKSSIMAKIRENNPKVNVKFDCSEDLFRIKANKHHLNKVLMNLVTNAAEAIGGEGEVVVSTENRHIDHSLEAYDLSAGEGDFCVLSVRDSGSGIAHDDMNRIFEPFYSSKMMGKSGTGLGMTIVYGAVKNLNGFINLQSEIGMGTNFELFFPIDPASMLYVDKSDTIGEIISGELLKCVIVDDNELQREFLTNILEAAGANVHGFASAGEALVFLQDHKDCQLAFVDLCLNLDGDEIEICRNICENESVKYLIACGGFQQRERVKELLESDRVCFLEKPFSINKVASLMTFLREKGIIISSPKNFSEKVF